MQSSTTAAPRAGLATRLFTYPIRLQPVAATLMLIAATAMGRLLFAALTGLGIDESYMVAAVRGGLQLSYHDHPPLSRWLYWPIAHLLPVRSLVNQTSLLPRLPFIVLFGLTTWLVARIATLLSSPKAGLAAATALSLAPFFGVTTAGWILPDGPLDAALAGFGLCLLHALREPRYSAVGWWMGAGLCAGLAVLSKYTAVLVLGGAVLAVATQPEFRPWLRRPQPWLAAGIAFVLPMPLLQWNAADHWVSFLVQAEWARGLRFRPFAPFTTLGGEALFLLPWIYTLLVLVTTRASRSGSMQPGSWLLLCCGLPTIILFTLIGVWSARPVLFHWAAPGYLMLLPVLGDYVVSLKPAAQRLVSLGSRITGLLMVAVVTTLKTQEQLNWLPIGFPDPLVDALDRTSLRPKLASPPGFAGRSDSTQQQLVVAGLRWQAAGKLDHALGDMATIVCLGQDPREYGILKPLSQFRGRDIVIVAPRITLAGITAQYGTMFTKISLLTPLRLLHAGRTAMLIPAYIGHDFRPPPVSNTCQPTPSFGKNS